MLLGKTFSFPVINSLTITKYLLHLQVKILNEKKRLKNLNDNIIIK